MTQARNPAIQQSSNPAIQQSSKGKALVKAAFNFS